MQFPNPLRSARATEIMRCDMEAVYEEAAFAINERRMESREVARRKVIELAADLAFIFMSHDDDFNQITFYRYCGFSQDDYQLAGDRNINDYNKSLAKTNDSWDGMPLVRGH